MCANKTWFYNDSIGYVIECLDCHHIQLGFGNIMVTFGKDDFEVFRRYIRHSCEKYTVLEDPKVKSIVLKTPCRGINFLLSEAELHGLHTMIDYADTEMKAASLLKLFTQ